MMKWSRQISPPLSRAILAAAFIAIASFILCSCSDSNSKTTDEGSSSLRGETLTRERLDQFLQQFPDGNSLTYRCPDDPVQGEFFQVSREGRTYTFYSQGYEHGFQSYRIISIDETPLLVQEKSGEWTFDTESTATDSGEAPVVDTESETVYYYLPDGVSVYSREAVARSIRKENIETELSNTPFQKGEIDAENSVRSLAANIQSLVRSGKIDSKWCGVDQSEDSN